MARSMLREWIDVVRAARGQTLADVAARLGTGVQTLSRLNTERRWMKRRVQEKLAAYLDIEPTAVVALLHMPAARDTRNWTVPWGAQRAAPTQLSRMVERVRVGRGHSAGEMAARCEIDPLTLYRMLLSERPYEPEAGTWAAVAAYLGMDADRVRAMADRPAEDGDGEYPIATYVGAKRHPTLRFATIECAKCPVRTWCEADVLAGDFAWCEALADVDFQPD